MKVVQVESWAAFRQVVDQPFAVVPVYWRGHASAHWLLASAFERMILAMPGRSPHWTPGFYASIRDRYLNAFKAAASGLRGPNPAKLEDDDWWALGRHYGLVTPLLDWTEVNIWEYIERERIPLVPLYFDRGDGQRYRSLGCWPCTGPIASPARSTAEVLVELRSGQLKDIAERSGRAQDQEDGGLERLRRDGYM